MGVIVAAEGQWGEFEEAILAELRSRQIPAIVAFNKSDLAQPPAELTNRLKAEKTSFVSTIAVESENPKSAHAGLEDSEIRNPKSTGLLDLREALIRNAPEDFINAPSIVGDLVPPGELVVLVVPIDLETPKGRLILPQVQAIRDVLDVDSYCMVVKGRQLRMRWTASNARRPW